jgi:hypothetical protein
MNKAVKCFGTRTVMTNIGQFLNAYPGINLISIGSGNGLLEDHIKTEFGTNTICIDPNPESYSPPPIVTKPDFPSVTALIERSPELVGNCLILLNWCNPNESRYDFDAIQSLRPIAFISIFESYMEESGAAGGQLFYDYIRSNSEYSLIHSTNGIYSGLLIEWYQQKELPIPEHNLKDKVYLIMRFDEDW